MVPLPTLSQMTPTHLSKLKPTEITPTECTNHTNTTKTARPETETLVSSLQTEKMKED
jgi:hypothetical protein